MASNDQPLLSLEASRERIIYSFKQVTAQDNTELKYNTEATQNSLNIQKERFELWVTQARLLESEPESSEYRDRESRLSRETSQIYLDDLENSLKELFEYMKTGEFKSVETMLAGLIT
ncbi:hypothetical protein MMC25_002192 [Agyrium rufum]|nr:hypothetical protein [Agyrium rufum]